MRVLRGRASTLDDDREVAASMLSRTAETGVAAVRVWAPYRHVAFGRRDARSEGYESACAAARGRDFQPVERSVGGRAVAYTGETLAFAVTVPLADTRSGLGDRYETATKTVLDVLEASGASVERGEPSASYCPGDHSIRVRGGGKVAGIAQRVRKGAALVSGCLTVRRADETALTDVLVPVYTALNVPFDPETVGSVAGAGGPTDQDRVARALETAFVDGVWGDGDAAVENVGSRSTT